VPARNAVGADDGRCVTGVSGHLAEMLVETRAKGETGSNRSSLPLINRSYGEPDGRTAMNHDRLTAFLSTYTVPGFRRFKAPNSRQGSQAARAGARNGLLPIQPLLRVCVWTAAGEREGGEVWGLPPPPSASNNQVILMHKRPHRPDQLSRFIGLGEEKPAFGHILLANSNVARCKHKLDRWPAVPDGVCKP
ncbi:MAG: hypothetical protein QOJ15_3653, partial [Bradyrhizobium sp.]|nr:hypothetical protein [Bradyrhizobium sp.]